MRCPFPIWVKVLVGAASRISDKLQSIEVPCGRCRVCRLNKAREWSVRIMDEVKHSDCSCFVTLTYDDLHLPPHGSLVVEDCQKFFKRLRKAGYKFRYYLGGEYGERGRRPHYHAILFGLSQKNSVAIERAWGLGYIRCFPVSWDAACYVAQYTEKKLYGDAAVDYVGRGVIPEFSLMSQGIGKAALEKNAEFLKSSGFAIVEGKKVSLPRYYREKLFLTDEDKIRFKQLQDDMEVKRYEDAISKGGVEAERGLLWFMRNESMQGYENLKVRSELRRRKL